MDSHFFKGVKVSLKSASTVFMQCTCSAGFGCHSDWDSDKIPAFIPSAASQELFDTAVSAICACGIQSSPPSVQLVRVCLYFSFSVYFWLLPVKPASLCDI